MALTITQASTVLRLLEAVHGMTPTDPQRLATDLDALGAAAVKTLGAGAYPSGSVTVTRLAGAADTPPPPAAHLPEPDGTFDGVFWYNLPALDGGLVVDATGGLPPTYRTGPRGQTPIERSSLRALADVLNQLLAVDDQTLVEASRKEARAEIELLEQGCVDVEVTAAHRARTHRPSGEHPITQETSR